MTTSMPYLLRALNEWILDNGMTPHIIVDTRAPGVQVPPGSREDGKLVLNIAPRATRHLEMGNDTLAFEARFGGSPHRVVVPIAAILAIYARENGQGMVFAQDGPEQDGAARHEGGQAEGGKPGGPNLRVIK